MIKPNTVIPYNDNKLNVVAVIGWVGDFAVYQSYNLEETAMEVARFGDKLSEYEARRLFPELKDYSYRY